MLAMRPMALFLPLLIAGASARAQTAPPPLSKGTIAYLFLEGIDAAGRPDGEGLDSRLFATLAEFKRAEVALSLDPDSEEGRRWADEERDLYERRRIIDVRAGTRVKILDRVTYLADTPEVRAELERIATLADPAERARALAETVTTAYQVEILGGNYRGRRGWVNDFEVATRLPKGRQDRP